MWRMVDTPNEHFQAQQLYDSLEMSGGNDYARRTSRHVATVHHQMLNYAINTIIMPVRITGIWSRSVTKSHK